MIDDELMEDPSPEISPESVHDIYFQFGEDEPIHFAYTVGDQFSLTLQAVETNEPAVTFSDGKGNSFKIFMRKNGI